MRNLREDAGRSAVMQQPTRTRETIRFGEDFELDPRGYELRRSGRALRLERIPMEILLLLVEHSGELVTREQIVEKVWGKEVFLDTDNSINGAIRKVRQVLKDHPERPRFVQTVTGKGYRFLAPIDIDELQTESPAAIPARPEILLVPQIEAGPAASATYRRWFALGGILLTALIAAGGYFLWHRSHVLRQAPNGRQMIAVVPFKNLTGDEAQGYFSDGLTEEMITQLGRLNPQRLGVIARTSAMVYKDHPERVARIGQELGVQYVLEGSVRRAAGKVRITAQLIETRDNTHVWAREYDRDLTDLLALQGEIAQEIADEIQLTLGDRPKRQINDASSPVVNYEAYDLYLKGRYFWNKRTPQALEQAVEYFQKSISKDPNYAQAYAGLADSYVLMSGYTLAPQTEYMPKARAAALKALELDPELAEGHASLGLINENYDWDWQTAEKEFRRAIQLDSNDATAHHWYAEYLANQGRFDEAFAESERARQLDPLSLIIATDHAAILYFSRQYDRAIEQFRTVLEMEPNFPRAHIVDSVYAQSGRYTDAITEVERWQRMDGTPSPWSWAALAYIYGRSGKPEQARHALGMLEQFYRHQQLDPSPIVVAQIGMGHKEDAVIWLQKAYLQHCNLTTLKVDPIYDPLRSDPRFQEIVRKIGLAQ